MTRLIRHSFLDLSLSIFCNHEVAQRTFVSIFINLLANTLNNDL